MGTYYAFQHRYGAGTTDGDGDAIGTVLDFATRAERDEFVDLAQERQPYSTNAGYTEAVTVAWLRRNHQPCGPVLTAAERDARRVAGAVRRGELLAARNGEEMVVYRHAGRLNIAPTWLPIPAESAIVAVCA